VIVKGSFGKRIAAAALPNVGLEWLADFSWAPDSTRIAWVVSNSSGRDNPDDLIGVIEVATGRILARHGAEHWSFGFRVTFDKSGEWLYTHVGHVLLIKVSAKTLNVDSVFLGAGISASFSDVEERNGQIFAFHLSDPVLRRWDLASWSGTTGALRSTWKIKGLINATGLDLDSKARVAVISEWNAEFSALDLHVQSLEGTEYKTVRVKDADNPSAVRCQARWRVSPDGSKLAVGVNSGITHVYSLPSGKVIRSIPAPKPRLPALSVDWSPNGKILAVGYSGFCLRLFDADTGAETGRIEHDRRPTNNFQAGVEFIRFSPDGKLLGVLMRDGSLQVFRLHRTESADDADDD